MYFVWRWIAFGAAGLTLAGSYPLFLEGRWIETTHTRIEMPRLHRPLRVLHLSDLHMGENPTQARLEELARDAVAEKPDLICLTGDYVDGHFALKLSRLEPIVSIVAKAAPTYAVMGNHDGGAWAAPHGDPSNAPIRQSLENAGAIVLHNRWQKVNVRGQDLLLVGTGDLWSGEADAPAAFANAPTGLPTLVLTHNPDTKHMLIPFSWDLLLAGHTHGNQVNLPFYDEPWATVHDRRFIAGHYYWEGRQLYINRGLGGVGGVRFRSRPEISILELVPRV